MFFCFKKEQNVDVYITWNSGDYKEEEENKEKLEGR